MDVEDTGPVFGLPAKLFNKTFLYHLAIRLGKSAKFGMSITKVYCKNLLSDHLQ